MPDQRDWTFRRSESRIDLGFPGRIRSVLLIGHLRALHVVAVTERTLQRIGEQSIRCVRVSPGAVDEKNRFAHGSVSSRKVERGLATCHAPATVAIKVSPAARMAEVTKPNVA
jgi:hypothetical protein